MSNINTRRILKLIGCSNLSLVKGEGYWYFIYDDKADVSKFKTHSVYVMYLQDLSVNEWVNEGRDFVNSLK